VLWGPDWQIYTERLLRASLLVKRPETVERSTRYTMLPFMNKYACELLKVKEKRKLHRSVCHYLLLILIEIFKIYGTHKMQNNNNQVSLEGKLIEYESNIWACIYRAVDEEMVEDDNIYRARRKEVDRLERSLYESISNVRSRSPSVNLDNSHAVQVQAIPGPRSETRPIQNVPKVQTGP